ncbi:peptidase A24 [Mycobacterium sp. 852002-51961_SCH5331710]|nr:peptidase A24 [Mycobacterium sp. 852002-51961_SCH5331710]
MALSAFDIRQRRLPNWLTLPGALAILILASVVGRGLVALTGALALFAVYLAVHLVAPTAMGAGDVKLAIGIGALTGSFGVDAWALSALGAPLVTAVWAVGAVLCRSNSPVPHGLSMCLAAAAATALVVI